MNDVDDIDKKWYAIRITYNRELKVKADLEDKEIEFFLPMVYHESVRKEKRVKILVPAIHNLIFIHCSQLDMIEYKEHTELPIRYIMDRETNRPIVIPKRQMDSFIAVAGNYDEQIVYLDYNVATLKRGAKVRVTGGIFAGAIGEFVRIQGDRRVVVVIPGVAAVATAYIHPSLIEKIDNI